MKIKEIEPADFYTYLGVLFNYNYVISARKKIIAHANKIMFALN